MLRGSIARFSSIKSAIKHQDAPVPLMLSAKRLLPAYDSLENGTQVVIERLERPDDINKAHQLFNKAIEKNSWSLHLQPLSATDFRRYFMSPGSYQFVMTALKSFSSDSSGGRNFIAAARVEPYHECRSGGVCSATFIINPEHCDRGVTQILTDLIQKSALNLDIAPKRMLAGFCFHEMPAFTLEFHKKTY